MRWLPTLGESWCKPSGGDVWCLPSQTILNCSSPQCLLFWEEPHKPNAATLATMAITFLGEFPTHVFGFGVSSTWQASHYRFGWQRLVLLPQWPSVSLTELSNIHFIHNIWPKNWTTDTLQSFGCLKIKFILLVTEKKVFPPELKYWEKLNVAWSISATSAKSPCVVNYNAILISFCGGKKYERTPFGGSVLIQTTSKC